MKNKIKKYFEVVDRMCNKSYNDFRTSIIIIITFIMIPALVLITLSFLSFFFYPLPTLIGSLIAIKLIFGIRILESVKALYMEFKEQWCEEDDMTIEEIDEQLELFKDGEIDAYLDNHK